MIARWRAVLVPLALMLYLLILAIGNWQGLGRTLAPDTSDKTLHLIAYGGLAALMFLGLQQPPLKRSLIVLMLTALLGAVDETIQSFVPYRDADALDWLADMAGAALVCGVLSLLRALIPPRWRGC